ncbi:ribonuclease HII [Devriesea agamarum]|uniref:ribonuclease HII n=1 Tax=Devriesea agamarum TaxID=472569 RepID=UPI00155E7869|nr:ribonuclease HII [Devriesea agamarum]
MQDPDLSIECELAAAIARQNPLIDEASELLIVGVDEVGRGALAGPVVVGAVAARFRVDPQTGQVWPVAERAGLPEGIRDSKLLTPARRVRLAPQIRQSATAWGIGLASPAEIDAFGIVGALSRAGHRALSEIGLTVDAIILDGSHNWLHAVYEHGEPLPFDAADGGLITSIGWRDGTARGVGGTAGVSGVVAPVRMRVGADRCCLSVAAASVIAKVFRDDLMVGLSSQAPSYAWDRNKGYGSVVHRAAIAELGLHEQHRRSWRLVGEC